jgi:lysyl-tRNA synthetase class II
MNRDVFSKWWFWIIVVLACLLVSSVVFVEDIIQTGEQETTAEETQIDAPETEPSREYMVRTVTQLIADLEANAMNAKEKYEGEYVEITGRVDTIDASGVYIGLYPSDDEWALTGVTCLIKNKKQKEFVRTISTGDIVTVRGKITSVGELMGFSLNIEEFVEN